LQLISPNEISLSEAYNFGVEIDFDESSLVREDDAELVSSSEPEEIKFEDPNKMLGYAESLMKYLKQTNGSSKNIKTVENIKREILSHLNFSELMNNF